MGEFGFSQSFRLQTKPDNDLLVEAVTATSRQAGAYVQYPALKQLQLEKPLNGKGNWMRAKHLDLMSDLVRPRLLADKKSQHDLFPNSVDAEDPQTGHRFSESELWIESRFLLITGKAI